MFFPLSTDQVLYLHFAFFLLLLVLVLLLISVYKDSLKYKKDALEQCKEASKYKFELSNTLQDVDKVIQKNEILKKDVANLAPYAALPNAFAEVERKSADAERRLAEAKRNGEDILREARQQARDNNEESNQVLKQARERADSVLSKANIRAKEIAGEAWEAKDRLSFYQKTANAMKNKIEGYGDDYLIPNETLIDDLAEDYGHEEAGRQLKLVRSQIKIMIRDGSAADCDYKESVRRQKSIEFALDAFNGKAETILAKVKTDNYGVMKKKLEDAYQLVNHNGLPFKNARILQRYADLYQAQLKYAIQVKELKQRDRDEQRRIKTEMREEERAQREFKKAQQQAEKERKLIARAVKEAESKLAKSADTERLLYQSQLDELMGKLSEAEAKNQRAISMAQQTKQGHVYVISNVGSFGENVLKVGMTRRLEPLDRVKELGDASVPFGFDVHAVIFSEDAPKLERYLHAKLQSKRVNRVNLRKEFFSAPVGEVRAELEALDIKCQWTMKAVALEYRESMQLIKASESDISNDSNALEIG